MTFIWFMLVVCGDVKTDGSPRQTEGYKLVLMAGALGWQPENLSIISSSPTSNSL